MADKSVLVIGAGIMGLSSAYLLHETGYKVTIYSKDGTQDTTSSAAGAFWEPYLVKPVNKALKWSKFTYDFMTKNILHEPQSGISEIVVEEYHNSDVADPWWKPIAKNFKRLDRTELKDIYTSGWRHSSLLIDTSVYLPWLLSELEKRGVQIEHTELTSFKDVPPSFDVVVNCAGLGARDLCNDTEVYPIRGQVVRVAPNGFNKIVVDQNDDNVVYVVPRAHDIIIGGTSQANDWNLQPDPKDTDRIMKKVKKILPEFSNVEILGEKVGLRPARSAVRLETESFEDRTIVHNYGHGGSGFTIAWGCADEVVELVKSLGT